MTSVWVVIPTYDERDNLPTVVALTRAALAGCDPPVDGTVLVVDDGLSGETMEPSAELYDPDIGRWVLTASPAHDRRGYSATRLTDGRVLVVGDYTGDGGRSSEVYDPGA